MEEPPQTGPDGAEPELAADGIPLLPPEVSTRERELRELIDAGAASPEELRALAEKLKEQRSFEQSVWREDVRPALLESKKRRFHLPDRNDPTEDKQSNVPLALALLGGVLLLFLIATQTSFWILLVAAAGVLVYAWVHGAQSEHDEGEAPTPPDSAD